MAYTKYGQKSSALQAAGSAKSSAFVLNPVQKSCSHPWAFEHNSSSLHGLWALHGEDSPANEQKNTFFWMQKYLKREFCNQFKS